VGRRRNSHQIFVVVVVACAMATGATAQTLTITKELGLGQGDTVLPGEPVNFRITLENSIGSPLILDHFMDDTVPTCFEPFTDCSDVSCFGGSDCGTCQVTATGFSFTELDLPSGSTMIFDVMLTAGPDPGDCTNVASSEDPDTSDPISDDETVSILGPITLTKTLADGQTSTPAPGEPVVFEIEIVNGGGMIESWPLTDFLDLCFEPISCDDVTCAGGVQCGVCIPFDNPGENGFDHNGFDLAAAGQPGDTITYTVDATAGSTVGECCNLAITLDPVDFFFESDDECVFIGGIFLDGFESGDTSAWSETVP